MPPLAQWLATLAAVAVAVLLVPSAAAAQQDVTEFYGVNAQSLFELPAGQVDRHLATMAAAGLGIVRRDASWNAAEPARPVSGQHSYDWTRFDREVLAYAQHGLRWLPTLDYSNDWSGVAAPDPFSAPAGTADYAAYAGALARRYGPRGSFWALHPELEARPVRSYEIWNEPNSAHFWHPQENAPERYADLYMAAREAIRAVDPGARVIVGGLALSNNQVTSEHEFLERMYRHRPDLAGNVDAIGFHPYTATAAGVFVKLRELRETLARHGGGGIPIELTELGWTTVKTPEPERAAALAALARELPGSDCNVTSLVPHTWISPESDPGNPDDWFGIYNRDGTSKPSGEAYLAAVRAVRASGSAAGGQCGASLSNARLSRLVLRFRVRRSARHARRLRATLRCPRGCRLVLEMRVVGAGGAAASGRRLLRRSLPFSPRRRTLLLRVPGRNRRIVVRATAVNRQGGSMIRSRTVRLARR
jgi:hypothetical protein